MDYPLTLSEAESCIVSAKIFLALQAVIHIEGADDQSAGLRLSSASQGMTWPELCIVGLLHVALLGVYIILFSNTA